MREKGNSWHDGEGNRTVDLQMIADDVRADVEETHQPANPTDEPFDHTRLQTEDQLLPPVPPGYREARLLQIQSLQHRRHTIGDDDEAHVVAFTRAVAQAGYLETSS